MNEKLIVVIPQSIDWAMQPWAKDLVASGAGISSPTGEAMRIERELYWLPANFAPGSRFRFPNRSWPPTASRPKKILAAHPQPFVIKNPFVLAHESDSYHPLRDCGRYPCVAGAKWIMPRACFSRNIWGRAGASPIVLVSDGVIHSLVTNQEYKYAFNGNMGIVAGARLGGASSSVILKTNTASPAR